MGDGSEEGWHTGKLAMPVCGDLAMLIWVMGGSTPNGLDRGWERSICCCCCCCWPGCLHTEGRGIDS